jgi:hypothetical protein
MAKILQVFAPTALFKLQTETFPPPLILGFLEKILEKDHEVVSIDANNYGLFKFDKENIGKAIMDELLKDIKIICPEIILVSSWTYGLPFVIELVKNIKKNKISSDNKSPKIILGGYNATLLPKHTLEKTDVDYVFSGNNLFEFAGSINLILQGKLKTGTIISQKKHMDVEKLPIADFSSFRFPEKPKEFYLIL